MSKKYHVAINSFYITIDKVRYSNSKYMKCIVSYYSKTSDVRLAQEKNVKIYRDVMKHWELFE